MFCVPMAGTLQPHNTTPGGELDVLLAEDGDALLSEDGDFNVLQEAD